MKSRIKSLKLLKFQKCLFITFIVLFFTFGSFQNRADTDTNKFNLDNTLVQAAEENGIVRVIIEFSVAKISALTAASNNFQVIRPEEGTPQGIVSSDIDLSDAIMEAAYSILSQLNGAEYKVNHLFSTIPYMALDVSTESLLLLSELPEVLSIVEDKPLKLISPVIGSDTPKSISTTSEEPDAPQLNNTTGIIGANTAWGMGYTGTGWYVAVLDTGIRRTHQFFAGKTIIEACYSLLGHCPGDVTQLTGTGSAIHHPNTYAGWDHGTHVSGIATGNNGTLFGVAKDANIVAVQVFSKFADCSSAAGDQPCVMSYTSDQVAGLQYVYSIRGSYSISSVNMSLGGGQYSAACDSASQKAAIDNLRAVGIATVIATGNDGYCGSIGSPSCISTAVSIGASTDADLESSFNNWSSTLQDLFAPGSSIYSSAGDTDSTYQSWNGTSMATPHVAGAWALMKQAKPAGTVATLLTALENTGTPITSVCDGYTTPIPRINVDLAINSILSSITVQTPNGGEAWDWGEVYTIQWNAVGTTNIFKLTLWKNGVSLGVIKKKSAGNGVRTFNWTVGNLLDGTTAPAGTGYSIKIKEFSTAVADTSDSTFSIITPPISVISPNGFETLSKGTIHLVKWYATGTTGTFKVTLWKNGVSLGVIKKKSAGNGLRTFNWTVGNLLVGPPAAAGTGYIIKVKEVGTTAADTSNYAFTLN